MSPTLSDVGVRARGLATHLLSEDALRRFAHSSGSGVLAGALQAAGYWPAPSQAGPAPSVVETIDAAIEREVRRRLDVLALWLGERRPLLAAVFDYEERRAIRFWLRGIFSLEEDRVPHHLAPGASGLSRRPREEIAAAVDATALVRALQRAGSPFAEPLQAALRDRGEDRDALEDALDRTFFARALRAGERLGGRLLGWARDEIDLENAWDALAGAGGRFVEGGQQLDSEQHDAVAGEPTEAVRRRRLDQLFARSALSRVFHDPALPSSALESRARAVRIANEHRATRLDPLGAAPILEFVMRLRAERADLRRINWGVAQGRPAEDIIGQMARRS
ncbi:MAG: V-type ATPase subunit [Deltaproteobacteria bacterium]|nr:V-type ATPase subunit [Deltaproteobacteria bacterium]